MAYEEGSSGDSETEGESSSHCRICVSVVIVLESDGLRTAGVEKFGGLSSRAPSPGRACLFAADLGAPRIIPSKEVSPKERKKNSRLLLLPILTFDHHIYPR